MRQLLAYIRFTSLNVSNEKKYCYFDLEELEEQLKKDREKWRETINNISHGQIDNICVGRLKVSDGGFHWFSGIVLRQTYIPVCTHTHTHTYIYIYIYVCVCVCVLL